MKFLSPTLHGIMDYVIGSLMVFAPAMIGVRNDIGLRVVQVIGVIILLQALMTRFPVGVIKVLPLRVHLRMDMLIGLVLLLSPWAFGTTGPEGGSVWPYVILGLLILGQAMVTWGDPAIDRAVGSTHERRAA